MANFTANSGIKLILDGYEAGTWGQTTNEAWKRITALVGDCHALEVDNMPTGAGSTSATADGVTVGKWIALNTSNQGQAGSEQRTAAVEFSCSATVTGAITMGIYGDTDGSTVDKLMWIKNAFAEDFNLIIKSGTNSDSVTIPQGKTAPVLLRSSTEGGFTAGAWNMAGDLLVDSLYVSGTGGIEFSQAAPIVVNSSDTSALTINDGTTDLFAVDTTNEKILLDSSGDVYVDVSGAQTQDAVIETKANDADALTVTDGTNAVLTVDTTTNTRRVIVGVTGGADTQDADLVVYGDINTAPQPTTFFIDAATEGLRVVEGANVYTTWDTTNGNIENGYEVHAPDFLLTGSDGYINGTTTQGSSGIGFRNNSGEMELKATTSETWGGIYGASNADGDTVYFKSEPNLSLGTTNLAVGGVSEAHGLARIPRIIIAKMKCVSTDAGWATGDEIDLSSVHFPDYVTTNHFQANAAFGADATNVFLSWPTIGGGLVPHKSTGVSTGITLSKWDVYIECWE
jgi:hypothetical protein